ncbi:hypothetical protein CO172_03750 [Candidatus Uhrbacteria bacterium CG_4_9_14_3_um_filter_36_7]|uniref:Uncharacterized protein n=1 Tax=Candidatus Uhrbacteria bacterium CG_4_9_14_3_um_filter_36_7 TaxID=1975033 RepID=A0A2M7XES4_9BACT|nr:MAG: hypothetical protein CO172_03750 [Candidatus Uhrbacteria bacterium CG_4_9_14_3_um_filter_36_7]
MKTSHYHQSFSFRKKGSSDKAKLFILIVTVLVIFLSLFFVMVKWFRKTSLPEPNSFLSVAVPNSTNDNKSSLSLDQEIILSDLMGFGNSGTARRYTGRLEDTLEEPKNKNTSLIAMNISIKAQLPSIDTQAFTYEVWLLRPSPFDFFSLGRLSQINEGIFTFEWSSSLDLKENLVDYKKIIITQEPLDANPLPSTHFLEGVFENP